ncbi:MAG: glycoside hydrolase 5 family protein [Anaerolineae bacterium]
MSKWVPYTLAWDDSPIDLSFIFENERPAGKHGFLKADGDKLRFEDGTEARFWGTCFNSGANFPPRAYSEMVAKRLAKFGVNIMRTHQMDSEWATPNIFESNRANPKDDTRTFDPESIDRLDYLIYCLKEQGVYTYLDLLTYRQFRPGDEVDAVDQLPQAAKPYTYFDPRLIALQKEFNRDLWTHINPYTKLAYKDDPAICLSELKNESDLFTQKVVLEPYRTRFEAQYRQWAEENGLQVPEDKVDFVRPNDQVSRFMVKVMSDFYVDMIAYLRSIGVRAPINGTNWPRTLGVFAANLDTDFMDTHWYWNFPGWESERGADIRPMVGEVSNALATMSFERSLERPFFVSEWDHAWPAPYRAESPLWYAAVGALQGWSGFTIHTYRYGTHHPVDCMGATTINGITYRKHFDTFNDPAKFGLFHQAALIFRRGDVKESETSVAIQVPAARSSWRQLLPEDLAALPLLCEKHRMGLMVPDEAATTADRVVPYDQPSVDTESGEVLSDTGELYRNWQKRIGWIDTAMTKAAYGFLGEAGTITLDGLEMDVRTDFATIALSSLTDEPIATSHSLLLTAVGRSDNSDAKYNDEGTRQLSVGHAPVLIEAIEAGLRLKTSRPNLKVWVIADNKEAVTPLPTTYEDGTLRFDIGAQPDYNRSTMYYLIRI